jgi:hypothetical protein
MSWRTTAILGIVAALLGAAIWWSERHETEKKEAEEQAKRLYGELEAPAVEWFELRTNDGQDARLERKDGAWRVTKPVDAPADATAADGIAAALATLTSEGTIEDPQGFAVYGLEDGAKVVRFRAAGTDRELRIGKKTPVGANQYAATGPSGTVYTVPSYKATSLEKPLDDLRERRPLRFDRGGIARVEATWDGGGVVLEKKEGGWRMVSPMDTEADDETVETLLSDLVFLRSSGFIDQPPPDAQVGLDRPAYRVAVVDAPEEGKAPARHELAIGSVLDPQTRAGRSGDPFLYKLPNDRFDKLPKTVVAFRKKDLSHFVATDAQRFEITYADPNAASSQSVTISGESKGDEGWTTQPDAWESGKAARMIAELARLKADDIAAEQMGPDELTGVGLAPARATVRVLGKPPEGGGDAPELAHVLVGVSRGGKLIAKVPGRDTVYRVSDTVAEHVPISLEAYQSRFVAKEPPAPEPSADAPPAEPGAEGAPPALPPGHPLVPEEGADGGEAPAETP